MLLFTTMLYAQEHKHHHGEANEHMNKNKFETLVERFENPERKQWQKPDEVIKFLGKLKGKTVVDIGAGTGYFAFRLAPLAKTVIAADVDERFLEYIQKKNEQLQYKNLLTRKAEYNQAPVQENEADLVFSVNVYHHIENRIAYFSELYKKMKKGSELVIVDFKKGDLPHGPPDNMKIGETQVADELGKAGFKKVKVNTQTLPY
ncbi:MAG: class I SAM-dependent methyltransferase, partial [Raineya sp.]